MAAVLAGLVLAGCGGGDESEHATRSDRTEKAQHPPRTEQREDGAARTATSTSPEQQPGGAGDGETARVPALFTGRDGRIRPRVVRVPPFIAIQVELRSADGAAYDLRFGRRLVRDGQTADFAGLRAGHALVGNGPAGSVRIVANAQPGP